MTPFLPASIDGAERERVMEETLADFRRRPDFYQRVGVHDEAQVRVLVESICEERPMYQNDEFNVTVYPCNVAEGWPPLLHLSIKRLDREQITDWRSLQQIKNALFGPEYEAVQLFPAESRKVDTANQYHLFLLPGGLRFPFGFNVRLVTDDAGGRAKQAPGAETTT